MSGKCRPSLRAKTLLSVTRSNLSTVDKKCIHAVFNLVDKQKAEIEALDILNTDASRTITDLFELNQKLKTEKIEAVKEFALELKRIPRIAVYKNEIDNLLKERLGESDV